MNDPVTFARQMQATLNELAREFQPCPVYELEAAREDTGRQRRWEAART